MTDGARIGRLADGVFDAAYRLRDALIEAGEGCRGLSPVIDLDRLNAVLLDAGVELVVRKCGVLR